MDKNKVLFLYNVIDPFCNIGGAGEGLRLLLRDLKTFEFETWVCSVSPSRQIQRYAEAGSRVITRLPTTVRAYHRLNKIRGGGALVKLLLSRKMYSVLASVQPQVVDINLLQKWDSFDIRCARRFGAKVVAHVRALGSQFTIRAKDLALCDAVICVSHCVRESVLRVCPQAKAFVIYNGIDILKYKPNYTSAEARSFLGIPSDVKGLIASVGALNARKGHDSAIRSLAQIRGLGLEVALGIIGSPYSDDGGAELRRLKGIAQTEGVGGAVYFTGKVEQMDKVYAAADVVYALSHDGEAFGRIPIEAAVARRPVVATGLGATVEIVEEGKTGFLVSPGDIGDITRKTAMLFKDRDLYHKTIDMAAKRAESQFGSLRCAEETAKLYRKLCGNE